MNLPELLSTRKSKSEIDRYADKINQDSGLLKQLVDLTLAKDSKMNHQAAWLLTVCHDKDPQPLKPYIRKLILNLQKQTNVAVKRNSLRILQTANIPENLYGELADICFNYLTSEEPVAVKTFSLTVLEKICEKEPELKNELIILIEDQLPYSNPAFVSRGSKILKKWKKVK
jgi:hypothetical protein